MLKRINSFCPLLPVCLAGVLLLSFSPLNHNPDKRFPYSQAGLTERQAAAHLLDRFTFGARPGEVEDVMAVGLERWFANQLDAAFADSVLTAKLAAYPSLKMNNAEIVNAYPKNAQLLRMAIRDGAVDRQDIGKEDRAQYRQALATYMRDNGYKPQRSLFQEMVSQKIIRAVYTRNQLQEVLTSFWFNHFNVSLTDNDCARFIMAYERDVIRANALGNFETLLLATAKSAAMLTYLDNFRSAASDTAFAGARRRYTRRALTNGGLKLDSSMQRSITERLNNREQGLNENYAREIMELHTLGVDGGYTQADVTEVARVLTGWTIYPGLNSYSVQRRNATDSPDKFSGFGFVREGDFFFAANRHDQGEKVVMGNAFPANGGYAEGVALIKMLAHHPATAKFIARKIAVRFVCDDPPTVLVNKLAETFTSSKGDIKQVLVSLVSAPEFWSKEAVREKTKSPFELAISAVRGLDGDVRNPLPLASWISRMGEKMYAYQAPTGFPDAGQYWINTGALLTRMNFGLALAAGRINGIRLNLPGLNRNREPESAEHALVVYSQYLMPGRDLEETIKRLTPSIGDPDFSRRVREADQAPAGDEFLSGDDQERVNDEGSGNTGGNGRGRTVRVARDSDNSVLAQVVGVIIGSPEFQRR